MDLDFCAVDSASSMTSSRSAFPPGPFTIDSIRDAMKKLDAIDIILRIRVAPAAIPILRKAFSPAKQPADHDRFGFGLAPLTSTPIEIDNDLRGLQAEADWKSGKVDKFDLSPKTTLVLKNYWG